MTGQETVQRVEGIGHEAAHSHGATVHTHDHYHVSHHHRNWVDGAFGEWEHRTYWHTHEHNHSLLIHSHDYEHADENAHHASEAHTHDHADPTHSPA
jgi:urease accessory protein